ncbi:unnamed protein product [Tuber aestivum]|uniref:Uncharacterized protein n=1 Tax=Tuber aestivum TaxID=59557 RepID=A0A292PNS2_9PEZI|nr:unnamed protein product [Tuber aestivum]
MEETIVMWVVLGTIFVEACLDFCTVMTPVHHARSAVEEESEGESCGVGFATASWQNIYAQMDNNAKWVLASGRSVENVIYEACKLMNSRTREWSPARFFILDILDPVVKGWFRENEWAEITARLSPLPDPESMLLDSLKRFRTIETTTMLREVLTSGLLPNAATYDQTLHSILQWAEMVIRKYLMLLEAPTNPLTRQHQEGWYGYNIWSHILDDCFLDLKGLTVERKEVHCQASSERKNRHRESPTERRRVGNRLDGIIHTLEDRPLEYGGMEDGPTFSDVKNTKWLSDKFKLVENLRDMLSRLHEEVHYDSRITRLVKVVGILTGGLRLQYSLLGYPGVGYVCLLQSGEVMQVPITVKGLPLLLDMLAVVSQLKQVIKLSFEAVENRFFAQKEDASCDGLVGGNAMRSQARLGWAPCTP